MNSLASRLRKKRLDVFLGLVRAISEEKGACSILDVGGRISYWRSLSPALRAVAGVSLTLLNIESADDLQCSGCIPHVSVVGDACALGYADGEFDIVHSNSVIEHLGSRSRMEEFAREIRRVGRLYFIQTPSYWFPIEPHFRVLGFSLLPRPLQIRLLTNGPNGFYDRAASVGAAVRALEGVQLLDRRQMRSLFPDAKIMIERFAGFEKSLIAIRGA